jgi:hypothetical protein
MTNHFETIARSIDERVNDNMLAAHARRALSTPAASHGKDTEIQITPEVIRCWVSRHSGPWEIPVNAFLERGREHTDLLQEHEEHVSLQALCHWVQKTGINFEFEGRVHLMTFTEFHEHGDDQCSFDFYFEPEDEDAPSYTCLVLVPQDFAFRIGDADTTVGFEERAYIGSTLARPLQSADWREEMWRNFRDDLGYRAKTLCNRVSRCPKCRGESAKKKRVSCRTCGNVGALFITDHYEFGGAHVAPDEIATAYKATRSLVEAIQGEPRAFVDFMKLHEEVKGFPMLEAITEHAWSALRMDDITHIAHHIGCKWKDMRPTERRWIWDYMKKHDIGLFADGADVADSQRAEFLDGPARAINLAIDESGAWTEYHDN